MPNNKTSLLFLADWDFHGKTQWKELFPIIAVMKKFRKDHSFAEGSAKNHSDSL